MVAMKESNLVESGSGKVENEAPMDEFICSIPELSTKVDELEQRINDAEKFYLETIMKQPNSLNRTLTRNDKDMDKHIYSVIKRLQEEASCSEAGTAERMHELMRQFGMIFSQIISRPMDFSTIKNQMEAKDGTGYTHVREIYADARLVFQNALKYNDEKSDVYMMAKKFLENFEENWLQFLLAVSEEGKIQGEEETEAKFKTHLAHEAVLAETARDFLLNELNEVDVRLEELSEIALKGCRKMSIDDKRKLGCALSKLPPEELTRALEIVAQDDPCFSTSSSKIVLDMNAQSESTLWRLKYFVEDALEVRGKGVKDETDDLNAATSPSNKRKRECS